MGSRESGGIVEVFEWEDMPTPRKPGKPNYHTWEGGRSDELSEEELYEYFGFERHS